VGLTEVISLKPHQLGAGAAWVKLLAREGPVAVELISERGRGIPGLSLDMAQAALDQMKASGDYERIVEEARR
jgi:hypothetical protein